MKIEEKITEFKKEVANYTCDLVAVSKTRPVQDIVEAYNLGLKIFGENKVQELCEKQPQLPNDIEWHMIGHLQRNKVKYIAPFVNLIQSVDSERLLKEISKQALKNNRSIRCLLQVHIASESHKFGFDEPELTELFSQNIKDEFPFINIIGFMGMATFTENEDQIRAEFKNLNKIFQKWKKIDLRDAVNLKILSMGMTNDYKIALEEGSNMLRIGTGIFGARY